MKLILENFQIYEKLEIDFKDGLTIISGPSDSGKTSIMRALETLILNPSSNLEDIREGASFMKITLELNNKSYSYKKNHEGTTYCINNIEYSKIGRDNLCDISKEFNFVLDEEDEVLNVQGEWNTMFPFGRKDAGLFKLFEDVFKIINSSEYVKMFNSENLRIKKEINMISDKINSNDVLKEKIDVCLSDKYNENHLIDLNEKLTRLKNVKFIDINPIDTIDVITTKLFDIQHKRSILSRKVVDINIDNISISDNYKYLTAINSLRRLNDINKLEPIEYIETKLSLIQNVRELMNKISLSNLRIETLNKKLEELNEELNKINICPTCNQEIK